MVNGVRRLGRAMRPLAIKSAGGVGASASVIHHTGRTSGRSYATPVGAVPTDEGFVIALPYGLRADWLQNVLASGSATIVHDGSTHDVDRPEVVPLSAVEDQFSPTDQRAHRLFGVDQCLRVRRRVGEHPPDTTTPGAGVRLDLRARSGKSIDSRADPAATMGDGNEPSPSGRGCRRGRATVRAWRSLTMG